MNISSAFFLQNVSPESRPPPRFFPRAPPGQAMAIACGCCRRRALWCLHVLHRVLPCHLILSPHPRGPLGKYPTLPAPGYCGTGVQNFKGHQSTSPPGTVISASRTLGTSGTQSFQAPRYPEDSRDSVLLATQVPWGLAGLGPFRTPGTRGTGMTQSFQAPRYPWDWRDSVLSGPPVTWELAELSPFSPPGTLGTGGTQPVQPPKYPGDWVLQKD